jgi:hypothetical protein
VNFFGEVRDTRNVARWLFQAQWTVKVLNNRVAFAGAFFEPFAVENFDGAAGIFDRSLPLKNARGQTHAGPVGPKHGGQKIMSDAEQTVIYPVLHDQQPAGKALLNSVKPVAGGGLGGLHALDDSMAAGHELELRRRRQQASQDVAANPVPVAGDLHDGAVRTSCQSYGRWCAYQAFITDNTYFDSFSFLHGYNERNQTAIWKVCKFNLFAGLVQAGVVWHQNET